MFCAALAGCAAGSVAAAPFDAPAPYGSGLVVESRHERDGYVLEVVRFDSPVRGSVPGYLFRPVFTSSPGPAPAILMQHGMPGNRGSMRRLAAAYARAGVYVLSLSAPFNRADQLPYREPRLLPAPLFEAHDSVEVVQLVREYRRALGILDGMAEVDGSRIAYVGWSYGGWIGALLAAVEPDFRAVVLMAPTGGFDSWLRSQEGNRAHLALRGFQALAPEERARWLRSIEPLDAARWIGRPRRAPLLIQAGRQDGAVLPSEVERIYAAASPPKRLEWYDAGHALDARAFRDQAAFLRRELDVSLDGFAPPAELF